MGPKLQPPSASFCPNRTNHDPFKDPLKEIRNSYCPVDYLAYAARLELAEDGDFPPFVLEKRCCYVARLQVMATEPHLVPHVQALNAIKLLDRTKDWNKK